MSFILDALNKAQREREEQRQPVPQLSTVHDAPVGLAPSHSLSRGKLAVFGFAATASALLAVAAVWWLNSQDSAAVAQSSFLPAVQEQAAQAAPPAATAAPASDQPSARSSRVPTEAITGESPAANLPAGAVKEGDADVSGLYANLRHGTAAESTQATAAGATRESEPDSAPAVAPAHSSASAAPAEVATPSAAEPAPVSSETVAQPSAKPAPEPAPDSIHARLELQYLQQLSWSIQQSLPSINYSAHDPDAAPPNRSVVINGSTFRPGAQIAQDLVLEEVLIDGVVLRYRNQKFKLEALNSWVNL